MTCSGKVQKQRVLLRRANPTAHAKDMADVIHAAKTLIDMAPEVKKVPELLGLEGAYASAYFPQLGVLTDNDITLTTGRDRI
ncbi:MAG: CRISPR-associated endonuclease Cas1 [Arcanobacterium sp.]